MPRHGLGVTSRIPHHLVHKRQKDRLTGEVVPKRVERRCPHEHATLTDAFFSECYRPVVETGQNTARHRDFERAIAEELGGGEVTAMGRAENLEDGAAIVEIRQRAAKVAGTIPTGAGRCRKKPGCVAGETVATALLTENDDQPTAARHELLEETGCRRRDRRHVVQDHHLTSVEVGRAELVAALLVHLERRSVTDS